MALFAMGVVILLGPFSLILIFYQNIISAVIQIQSGEGRLKAFSTCGSHFLLYFSYGLTTFTYMHPNSKKINGGIQWSASLHVLFSHNIHYGSIYLQPEEQEQAFKKLIGR